jgi:cytochrome c-type biogenesis protein CcmH
MNEIDWTPAVAVVLAGLVVGAIVFWRVIRRGQAAPAAAPSLERRDLEGKYQALLAQLRELDDVAGKHTPEQVAQERHALEHAAARVLRDVERVERSVPAARMPKQAAPAGPAAAPAPASALHGFLWGVGSVAALGVLFYFVSQSAAPREQGGSLTGNLPGQEGGAAQPDAELAEQRAAVAKNPEDLEARLDLVRLLLVRQDMMAVFTETQAVLQRSPGNPRALSYQALVRLAMGQAQQAESMLKDALAKDPQLLDAYLHLMLVYVRSERTADAEKVLQEVSRRFPDRAAGVKQLLGEMQAQRREEPQAAEGPGPAEDPHADPHAGVGVAGKQGPEKRVAGTLELDPSLAGRSFAGTVVFVTLREGGFGAGPPLAARRLQAGSFPMPFEIGSSDSMTGEALPDDLLIEARIDTDGDPMTRPKTDPYGSADRVRAGSAGVKLVLKPRTP